MKFSLYSKKNVLDEMQEQTMSKIERRGFWLMWLHLCRVHPEWPVGPPSFFQYGCQCGLFSAGGRGGYGAVWPDLWLLDGRCVYWCFDRSALLCTAPILCTSGEEEPEKAGR